MISVLILCNNKKESLYLGSLCSYCMALIGDESLHSCIMGEEDYSEEAIKRMFSPNLMIAEATCLRDLERLKMIRREFPMTEILIISKEEVCPEYYLNPEILPSMLMLKPYTTVKAQKIIKNFLVYYCVKREKNEKSGMLPVTVSGEIQYFHYREISYLEAKEKKVILHSHSQEVPFTATLQGLEKELPKYFVRCHRSYIVNSLFVQKADITKGLFYTNDEAVIPISKKYKNRLRSLLLK